MQNGQTKQESGSSIHLQEEKLKQRKKKYYEVAEYITQSMKLKKVLKILSEFLNFAIKFFPIVQNAIPYQLSVQFVKVDFYLIAKRDVSFVQKKFNFASYALLMVKIAQNAKNQSKLLLGQCYQNCPEDTYQFPPSECSYCNTSINNCQKCSTDGTVCLKCFYPYKLTNNQCLTNCSYSEQDQDQDFICQACSQSIQFCGNCTEDGLNCRQCLFSKKLSQNQCLDKCDSSQLDIEQNNICEPCQSVIPFCSLCTQEIRNASQVVTCSACENPKVLTLNECLDNCHVTQQDSGKNRICQNCDFVLSHCSQCNQEGSKCTFCNLGYYIGVDNLCHSCIDFDPQCATCTTEGCISCNSPKKMISNTCQDSQEQQVISLESFNISNRDEQELQKTQ